MVLPQLIDYLDGGKLEIDEDKLRAAIEEDPNGIYELFMGNGEITDDGKTTTDLSKMVLYED